MDSLKIGNIKLKNPLILAPMLDVTDLPYRLLCRKAGASLAYTEMLNSQAILHENAKTGKMMQTCKEDSPLGIQVTGSNLQDFKNLLHYLKKYDLVDLNCSCPSDRIISNNSGSCLLKTPKKIAEIIRFLKSQKLIVTAKIRLGFKKNNVLEIAKAIEKAGADAITIHCRLANQSYDAPADWRWIAKVKKEIKIPIIANGDIFTGRDAEKALKIADAVMIARAAIGNPLVFKEVLNYLNPTGRETKASFKDRIDYFKKYLYLSEKYEIIDIPRIKYLGCNFIKNTDGASKLRNQLMQLKTFEEIRKYAYNLAA
jgi:nifR3 family TIM-barrel protein